MTRRDILDALRRPPFRVSSTMRPLSPSEQGCNESTFVSKIVLDCGQAWIRLGPVAKRDVIPRVFRAFADVAINVDVITQTIESSGRTLAITFQESDLHRAVETLTYVTGFGSLLHAPIAKLSLEGVGLQAHGQTAAMLFDALSRAGVNVRLISTSTRVISVVIDRPLGDRAFAAVCRTFDFPDTDDDSIFGVVSCDRESFGGTCTP